MPELYASYRLGVGLTPRIQLQPQYDQSGEATTIVMHSTHLPSRYFSRVVCNNHSLGTT